MTEKTKFSSAVKGDIFGGITAGIVALPLALAFGVQSGLGAEAGLYGAIGIGIIASIFGGTSTQISGPTGPMTVVSAALVASLIALKGNVETALPLIMLCFIMAGIFQILMGIIKVGQYIKYIPYPVVSGFMTGIGVIIILLQIFPSMGHKSPGTIAEIVSDIDFPFQNIKYDALILTLVTMIVVYIFPKITKVVPSTLVALVLVSLVPVFYPMDIQVIGAIPAGLPKLNFDFMLVLKDIPLIILAAVTLASLGAIDSLLTSVVADNITRTNHNSNKELIGQGLGNIASSLIGGIPGAGATMRTIVNIGSGGTTRLSGVVHGLVLLLILLGLSKLASQIPIPVLSGILITVGISIIDEKGIKHINKVTRTDAFVMLIVLLLTVFVDLLQAVAAGMIISSIIFIKQMGDITQKQSTPTRMNTSEENEKLFAEYFVPDELKNYVNIKKINGPLFFGNSEYFVHLSKQIPANTQILLIDLERVPYIDQSGLYALESVILNVEKQGVQVYLLHLQDQPKVMMNNINMIPSLIETEHLFDDKRTCMEFIKQSINIEK
ncbi:MAG: SulP family inorganic anion transporter [Saprospiraceae bacterium]|nr:SulP family inorganic anion transporter [Saprospiraceae bacterium]